MKEVIKNGVFYLGDCLEIMKEIPDKSIDMILCDLPYGTTGCKWDIIIPFEPLWKEYKRIIQKNAAIVLTASQPFASALVMSNIEMFKYDWIWESNNSANFAQAPYMPLKNTENIIVFSFGGCAHPSKNRMKYNPQGVSNILKTCKNKTNRNYLHKGGLPTSKTFKQRGTGYPSQIIKINKETETFHPTQKPVDLFKYLIKTYSNEGDLILDNCAGSGTTAVACERSKRRWICIEKEKRYYDFATERVRQQNHWKTYNQHEVPKSSNKLHLDL